MLIFSRSYTDPNKIFHKMLTFSGSYTISSILYIFSSGRKHALRKKAYLPNRTCVGARLMYQIKAYIHPNLFSTRCQISSMHSSTRKTPQKRTLKISLRYLLVNLKNVRVLAPPMLFSIGRWRQCQPLVFPPIQASNGALRSVKHERRNVVIRVRGCRMTKIPEQLYPMQTQQDVLLIFWWYKKYGGECKLQFKILSLPYACSVREVCRFP